MIEYIKRKDALHILDLVLSDENITHKYKAIRKRLKSLPNADVVSSTVFNHFKWERDTAFKEVEEAHNIILELSAEVERVKELNHYQSIQNERLIEKLRKAQEERRCR